MSEFYYLFELALKIEHLNINVRSLLVVALIVMALVTPSNLLSKK